MWSVVLLAGCLGAGDPADIKIPQPNLLPPIIFAQLDGDVDGDRKVTKRDLDLVMNDHEFLTAFSKRLWAAYKSRSPEGGLTFDPKSERVKYLAHFMIDNLLEHEYALLVYWDGGPTNVCVWIAASADVVNEIRDGKRAFVRNHSNQRWELVPIVKPFLFSPDSI